MIDTFDSKSMGGGRPKNLPADTDSTRDDYGYWSSTRPGQSAAVIIHRTRTSLHLTKTFDLIEGQPDRFPFDQA